MTLGCGGKSTSCKSGVCLAVAGTIASGGDPFVEAGHEYMRFVTVHQSHIGKAFLLLTLDKFHELLSFCLGFSHHKVASTTVVQFSLEFLFERLPSLDGISL